ncbi:hypothetical protein [Bacillus sp. BP-3]|uniref:hypothetical protein n=1 Tax=Bacillus sp. BP-3 TaxID=3022773 RepID=UPI00232CE33A|nr:hypothetical protein [Bacillus sp. BP-3]MDC2865500.1 hypothetical protein [Bacillus sp. BP-3]
MNFILENKWMFLIIAESVFWVSVISFLLLRYWFEFKKLSITFFILFIVNDLWIATMGFFDYLQTGKFSNYQVVIVVIIVYALTNGKSDFRRLDAFMQRKVAAWKGKPIPDIKSIKKLSGKEHARNERKHFFVHFLIYIIAHIILISLFGLSDQLSDLNNIGNTLTQWFEEKQPHFPSNNIAFNNLSRIWSLILAVDAVISLSYTFFPKEDTSKNTSY